MTCIYGFRANGRRNKKSLQLSAYLVQLFSASRLTAQQASEPDALPAGALARLQVREPSGPHGFDGTLTPDGRTMVVRRGTRDNGMARPFAIDLYDAVTGLKRGQLDVQAIEKDIAIAQTKPLLAIATASGVEVWDLEKAVRTQQWLYPDGMRNATDAAIAISPDGAQVAVARSSDRRALRARQFSRRSRRSISLRRPHCRHRVGRRRAGCRQEARKLDGLKRTSSVRVRIDRGQIGDNVARARPICVQLG